MVSIWGRIAGEMSKLRNRVGGLFAGSVSAGYKLNSSKVDYELARSLYRNDNDEYKLGSGFAQPIINTKAGFMGTPSFISQDKNVQEDIDNFTKNNKERMSRTQLGGLRDGDSYVLLTVEKNKEASLYPELKTRIIYNLLSPERVTDIILNPVTNDPIEYHLTSIHEWVEDGQRKKATIVQKYGAGYIDTEIEGDVPEGIKNGRDSTPWDFIPIVHFKNESDEMEKYGRSELEAIEPYLKAYHDVMLHAMQGSKMHSTPKLKLKLKDVQAFLQNNLGVDDIEKFIKEGKEISLDGQEMVLLTEGEDAEFIEARSATGSAKELLKLLFYCIVDTSETPEFAFGVHTPSNQASVKEQMPVFIRNIERKRQEFTGSWQRLARMVLAMNSSERNVSYDSLDIEIQWNTIDPRSGEEIANETKTTVEALIMAMNNDVISHEAVVEYLAKFINTMNDYESEDKDVVGEKERITISKLDRERMSDTELLEKQLAAINKKLGKEVV